AARRLGCPLGTLKSRLVRGRAALHRQLARRGLSLATVVSTLLLAGKSAAAPIQLEAATVKAATAFGMGSSVAGIIGPKAVALAVGVLKPTLWGKLKIVIVVLGLIVGGIGVGSATRGMPSPAAQEPVADRGELGAVAPLARDNKVPQ